MILRFGDPGHETVFGFTDCSDSSYKAHPKPGDFARSRQTGTSNGKGRVQNSGYGHSSRLIETFIEEFLLRRGAGRVNCWQLGGQM